jgi:hypothetical protein
MNGKGPMDGWLDGWMEGRKEGRMEGWMECQSNQTSHRVTNPLCKSEHFIASKHARWWFRHGWGPTQAKRDGAQLQPRIIQIESMLSQFQISTELMHLHPHTMRAVREAFARARPTQ